MVEAGTMVPGVCQQKFTLKKNRNQKKLDGK
jgi:hypothetical protein